MSPPEITEEPYGIANVLSPGVFTGAGEQSSRKGLLKDIFLEYSSPHCFNKELMVTIIRSNNSETLRFTMISPTKWKTDENINFHHDAGDMTLIIHSKDGDDHAFLAFTADQIYAMTCAEEDTPAEHLFASVQQNNSISFKMTSTVASSLTFGSGAINAPRRLAVLADWYHYEDAVSTIHDDLSAIHDDLSAIHDDLSAIHDDLSAIFNILGNLYFSRFKHTLNLQDIDCAISNHQNAVKSTPSSHANLPSRFNNLGNSYFSRFEHTHNLQDVDYAISNYQSALESTPSGHANFRSWFNNLGNSYFLRFEHTGNLHDIDCAISNHQNAVQFTPSDHANLPSWLNNLGNLYLCRFEHTGDLHDIKCAISNYQSAVESTPSGHANLPSRFNKLGNSYARRFRHTGNLQDIDCAISNHQSALESTPFGHADLPSQLNNLGNLFLCRFEHTGDLHDIEFTISYHWSAVESTPSGHADLPAIFNSLGNSYFSRFKHTDNSHDVDCAISNHQNAVEFTPSGHADLPGWFNNLGKSYSGRFERTGNLQDIDCAISHHRSAVESTPSGHARLPSRVTGLGNSYLGRYKHTGNLQDIEFAISHHQRAVESTPSGHADLPSRINNLGNSYLCRFESTGDLDDIECAVSNYQSAVESTPSGHADLPSRFNNLGNSYTRRFERTGNLQDIDCAISHHQSAVKSTPSGHANLPSWLNNLGCSYTCRFERTGDLHDIESAISHHQTAVESTPSDHADLSSWLNSLGSSYLRRFKCTGDLYDIECAISNHRRAIESTPSSHADLPSWLSNLGNSYTLRFERTGNLQDIEFAISNHRRAVESTPPGHANLSSWLTSLGTSYFHRFKHTGDLHDIERAISHHRSAAESTPSGHANLPSRLTNLGNSYLYRFKCTNYFSDAQKSIASFRQAAQANGAPSIRMKSAKNAAIISSVHDTSHCLADFSLAISLLSEAAGLEQTIHRRHANLHDSSDLVTSAVATALRYNQADLALEWLEQGRCLVWNQLDQLRTPIDKLHTKSPSLAYRFVKVVSALETYGTRSIPSSHSTFVEDIRLQNDTQNHTLHAAEYTQLLKEIRDLPDFHDFLQPRKATNLLYSLPSDGPVIIFNIYKTRCDALALIAEIGGPLHIPLENFSLVQAEELQKALQLDLCKQRDVLDNDRMPMRIPLNPSSMPSVLEQLWCNVVRPILEALGYSSEPPSPSDRRRIWWCPTGPLAFLPLHAAGIYGSAYQPGSCISDFVVSSYTPTVRSLNDKLVASSTSSKCTSLVLISQPNTPGLSQIPLTQKETHDLKALMKGTAIDTLLLEDSDATREKVKGEMKSRSWAHFACHGVQDVNQPLESGLCLHDGRLELLEIMKERIPNLDLAFLSACQTSKGDLKLSEEVVHLAAGMLAAGYRGVVGTMWSISDMHGPEFATEFYKYLLDHSDGEGLDSSRAAYALDYATKKVRERLGKSDAAFLTWVPYVHFGY
ncbi:hypothetical protein BYT27DRAFT_7188682 [Phlegmacium glaucopus]|nr:hypothetical protein BYT27DRAFT_7188682 [Phlegmacium glaucopus]